MKTAYFWIANDIDPYTGIWQWEIYVRGRMVALGTADNLETAADMAATARKASR